MKTRIASLILAFTFLITMAPSALADGSIGDLPPQPVTLPSDAIFYLDGKPLEGVAAENIDGNYYVALASIMPILDPTCIVEEDDQQATVTAQAVVVNETAPANSTQAVAEVLDTLSLNAVKGQPYVTANDRCLYVEDGVRTVAGMAAIPVRTLATILAMDVSYDDPSGQVRLTSPSEPCYLLDGDIHYVEDDLLWLSRIIYAESGNQSLKGKIAVGNVVMNRVHSERFPNSIYEVIFQRNQFSPAASGSVYRDPNEESVLAAKLVLEGAVVLDGVLFFNRAGMNCYASRNREYVATIGEHSFYA